MDTTGLLTVVAGVLLLLLGAAGATARQRRTSGRPGPGSLAGMVPFGVLVGAGAALVRGWDLGVAIVAGAVMVPLVGLLSDVLAARRRSRPGRRP